MYNNIWRFSVFYNPDKSISSLVTLSLFWVVMGNHSKTSGPIEVWKCNIPAFFGNYDRPTDQPTDGQESLKETYTYSITQL